MADGPLAVAQFTAELGDVARNVTRHLDLVSVAAGLGASIVVFPELSLTGYDLSLARTDAILPHDRRLDALRDAAGVAGITVVAGAPVVADDTLRIGAITFLPDGTIRTYTKQFLHEGEEATFSPGAGADPLILRGHVVALAICADATHPEHARAAARSGATVYAASCLITEAGYDADAALLRQIAIDNGMVTLMANYGGPIGPWSSAGKSAIWLSDGHLLVRAPARGDAILLAKRTRREWVGNVVTCAA